jgi:hypothetical protein|tara:strand:- start:344 stop:700 length:357 start_codon:yes stop_codon:yes gene_type:complete
MANVYKNIQATINQAATDVDMYTSPAATTSIVKTIRIFNTHSGALDVTSTVYDASSTTDFEWDKTNVAADNHGNLLTYNNLLVLEAGDILKMQAATTDVIKMTAAILQITRPPEVTTT